MAGGLKSLVPDHLLVACKLALPLGAAKDLVADGHLDHNIAGTCDQRNVPKTRGFRARDATYTVQIRRRRELYHDFRFKILQCHSQVSCILEIAT